MEEGGMQVLILKIKKGGIRIMGPYSEMLCSLTTTIYQNHRDD